MRVRDVIRSTLFSLSLLASQAYAEEVRIAVANAGVVLLTLPDGWRHTMQAGPLPTLSLTPAKGKAFEVLLSALVAPDGRLAAASPEALRRIVEASANEAQAQAVEKSLPLQEMGGGAVHGHYFFATDKAPKPGEFTYLAQGAMAVQGLPLAFTILCNGDPQATLRPALRMLGTARKQ